MSCAVKAIPLVLPYADWPLADRSSWQVAKTSAGYFEEGGAFHEWSKGTERLHRQGYGQWLSFILRNHPSLLTQSPAHRITQQTVKHFIEETSGRITNRTPAGATNEEGKAHVKTRTIANHLLSILTVARAFAPDQDWSWLARATRRTYRRANPFELKPRLPVTAGDLFRWSVHRLQEVTEAPNSQAVIQATHFRQALTVGMLIAAPVRVRAFVAMTVHEHLVTQGDDYILRFKEEDMKDRKAREFPVPAKLTAALARYMDLYRPLLLQGGTSDALWITARGNPMCEDSFYGGLRLLTQRHFGVAIGPHAFRSIAATTIAEYDPEHVNIIKDVLGHATLDMAERHYNRATGVSASSRLQALTQDIRRNPRKIRRIRRQMPNDQD